MKSTDHVLGDDISGDASSFLEVPFNKPFIVGKELYYIAQAVLVNKHLSGDGPFTRKCEEWLERRLGACRALLTHSGTAALEMVALALDIEPGDEVIMPSFTFVSTANAFVRRGATPVFVDIRPDTLNIDVELLRKAITSKTKGIVPVHYAGAPCEMDQIMAIAQAHGLWVAEDAAQALLSSYKGKFLGAWGHFGCLSFHETKNIISGEGGALIVNSDEMVDRLEIVREKGTDRSRFLRGELDKYTWVDIGSSYLPSELVAAFLYAQLEQADKIIEARCKLIDRYHRLLRPLEEQGLIRLPNQDMEANCNGHLFYIVTGSLQERSELIRNLSSRGIMALFHYVPLHSSPGGRKYGRVSGEMTATDEMSSRIVRLPIYYEMTHAEMDHVVKAVEEFYGAR